jgi:hypothetical protein
MEVGASGPQLRFSHVGGLPQGLLFLIPLFPKPFRLPDFDLDPLSRANSYSPPPMPNWTDNKLAATGHDNANSEPFSLPLSFRNVTILERLGCLNAEDQLSPALGKRILTAKSETI